MRWYSGFVAIDRRLHYPYNYDFGFLKWAFHFGLISSGAFVFWTFGYVEFSHGMRRLRPINREKNRTYFTHRQYSFRLSPKKSQKNFKWGAVSGGGVGNFSQMGRGWNVVQCCQKVRGDHYAVHARTGYGSSPNQWMCRDKA